MNEVGFSNIRALDFKERNKVRGFFSAYLLRHHVSPETPLGGELFALTDKGRVCGGVWIRTWPGQPGVGDVHIVSSSRRFSHYKTILAFDLFLRERERIMALNRWRVILEHDNIAPIRALSYLKFNLISQQVLPVIGEAVILEREVI